MAAKEDLNVKTDDQLQTQLGELKREQFNLRFQSATNQLEKPSRVREVRRTIARIQTRPVRRIARVIARRAASICRAVMRSGSNAFSPNVPKFSE